MCGIVGLFAKSYEVEGRLGEHLAAMLVQMSSRGPDSAGVAVYRDPAASGSSKLTLYSANPHEHWGAVMDGLRDAFGECDEPSIRDSHAVLVVDAEASEAEGWVRANRPDLRVMSGGQVIEIYKETGLDTLLEYRRLPSTASVALVTMTEQCSRKSIGPRILLKSRCAMQRAPPSAAAGPASNQ